MKGLLLIHSSYNITPSLPDWSLGMDGGGELFIFLKSRLTRGKPTCIKKKIKKPPPIFKLYILNIYISASALPTICQARSCRASVPRRLARYKYLH